MMSNYLNLFKIRKTWWSPSIVFLKGCLLLRSRLPPTISKIWNNSSLQSDWIRRNESWKTAVVLRQTLLFDL